MTDQEIIAIRDKHLPSQGDGFDCIAFARDILATSTASVNHGDGTAGSPNSDRSGPAAGRAANSLALTDDQIDATWAKHQRSWVGSGWYSIEAMRDITRELIDLSAPSVGAGAAESPKPADDDCEDQGFSRLVDGCFRCVVFTPGAARGANTKLVKRGDWWVCPTCKGSYGPAPKHVKEGSNP